MPINPNANVALMHNAFQRVNSQNKNGPVQSSFQKLKMTVLTKIWKFHYLLREAYDFKFFVRS